MAQPKGTFSIVEFTNESGTLSYRVSGTKLDKTRVRKNFTSERAALAEKNALETEAINAEENQRLRLTSLTPEQVRLAEIAFTKLKIDDDLLRSVESWNAHAEQVGTVNAKTVESAHKEFVDWVDATKELRDHSKRNLKTRIGLLDSLFALSLSSITPEQIEKLLVRDVSGITRDNDKRALSRFFSWCMERPRHWIKVNPCSAVQIEKAQKAAPTILTVEQCRKLMRAAEAHKAGRCVRYTALCLFGKLRPFEAQRVTAAQINLHDKEIRLEASQTKTGRSRVVSICKTLKAWLEAYPGEVHYGRKDLDAVKQGVPWSNDILRHTGISHFFRKTGSYGLTAEESGNSEPIIKAHYQGRVSSADTKRFYKILPKKKTAKKATKAASKIILLHSELPAVVSESAGA